MQVCDTYVLGGAGGLWLAAVRGERPAGASLRSGAARPRCVSAGVRRAPPRPWILQQLRLLYTRHTGPKQDPSVNFPVIRQDVYCEIQ